MSTNRFPSMSARPWTTILILVLILILIPTQPVRAATKTSTGNCNWSSASCWTPSGVPVAGDDVQIRGTHTVTLDVASATVNSLTINSDSGGGACGLDAGANSITVTNAITFNPNNSGGICQIAITSGSVNAASLTLGGGSQPSQVNIAGIGSLNISGAVTIDAPTAASITNQIAVGAGTFSAGSLTINGGATTSRRSQVTVTSGNVTVTGNVTFGAGVPSAQRLEFSGAGIANLGGDFGTGGTLTASTGTVNLNGSGAQSFGGYTYYNLNLNNAGTKTPAAAYTVNKTLTIASGVTLDESTRTLSLPTGTNVTVNGTLDFTAANGEMQNSAGTTTITMGATGWVRTIDANGLGPATGASLSGTWDTSSLSTSGTVEYARDTTSGQIVTDRDYNHLVISGSTQTKTWILAASRTLNGNLTVNSGAPLTLSGANTVNIKGNWSNSGTFNAGASAIQFNGASAQTISGSSATTFNNLTIDNTSDISLSGTDATVNGSLTFTNGKIVTGVNTLILGPSGIVSGAGATKYVHGKQQKIVPTGSPTITFEVGDASVYAPISITFNSVTTGGTLTGSTTGAQHPIFYSAGIGNSDYIERYWTLTPSGLTFTSYDATFTFANPGDIFGAPSSLIVQKWDGTAWTDPASSSYTSTTVTGNGFTSFSDFFAGQAGVPTPVSLSHFRAARDGNATTFEWSTETETGNVGFNLYAEINHQRIRVNDPLIPSNVIDSLERQDYSFRAGDIGEIFYLEEVSILGETRLYGPFLIENEYGSLLDADTIHWDTIPATKDPLRPDLHPAAPSQTGRALQTVVQLRVRATGLHRVTYEMLREVGFDLGGVPSVSLRLTNRGQSVPIFIHSNIKFGPGDYFEFYGEALDTIYTDTNVYILSLNHASPPAWIPVDRARPLPGAELPASFSDAVTINNQRVYASYAPGEDAWYDTYMMVYTSAQTWEFPFQLQSLADPSAETSLHLILWGLTTWPQDNDHHALIAVNGVTVADLTADGFSEAVFDLDLPGGILHEGENILQVTLPGDTGAAYDVIALDKFSVTYPRTFEAQDGQLDFTAEGRAFQVTNLPSKNIVVYRIGTDGLVRLSNVQVQETDGIFTAAFAGTPQASRYLVSAAESLHPAEFSTPHLPENLNRPAQYLIIAHSNFIDSLQPLIQARQAQGFTVNVVDVNDLYSQYSGGIFDPQAIKQYIAYAKKNLGAQYVLLVGGDTYDYRDHLGVGSVSFVPSLYADTGTYSRYVPSDALFADVNNDIVPDLAIGRFPVRTNAELETIIAKTLAYQNKDYARTAVFVSDQFDGMVSFKQISDNLADTLPSNWSVQNIHLDDSTSADARTQLLDAMNRGTALVTFTGHSGPATWTFHSLFNTVDAVSLTNTGRPFVVVQWGCWNTYYVDPIHNYLVHSLMVSGDHGAAAVLGAASRTDSNSEKMLGLRLTPRLVAPGTTIGQALQFAKADLAATNPHLLDVLLGWSLMGDPALIVQP